MPDHDGLDADRVALVLVVTLAAMAVLLGLRADRGDEVDVDQAVYTRTLQAMRAGEDYYPAMRDALVVKEGAPPTQVRSIRPPTLFVALARAPESGWRWLVGLPVLLTLLATWRLGRRPGDLVVTTLPVVLAGLWLMAASPLLLLHPELWGLPFALAGLLCLRSERAWPAAALLVLACALRETYVVVLLAAVVVSRPRRPLLAALAAVAALAAAHAAAASSVLSARGYEPPFGGSGLGWRYVLQTFSPADTPFAWAVGAATLGLGGAGAWWAARARSDPAAATAGLAAAVLLPTTVLFGRTYWSLTYCVGLCAFAGAGWRTLRPARAAGTAAPTSQTIPRAAGSSEWDATT